MEVCKHCGRACLHLQGMLIVRRPMNNIILYATLGPAPFRAAVTPSARCTGSRDQRHGRHRTYRSADPFGHLVDEHRPAAPSRVRNRVSRTVSATETLRARRIDGDRICASLRVKRPRTPHSRVFPPAGPTGTREAIYQEIAAALKGR
jgi:hypothetical protein